EKFSEQDVKLLKTLVESGTPIKSIADSWGVSRTTIYRYINKPELLVDYLAMT
ncbi:helix-turn-helix domain-containing protein, partial [Acinetobacter baumannii]|uniref:helix-turn-helix domain-containing protein n=1 Tax=Acinetobacter baumannii TaxID=470 RepID=UPI00227979C1